MDQSVEERACGDYDALRRVLVPGLRGDAEYAAARRENLLDHRLFEVESGLRLESAAHCGLVEPLVGLSSDGSHGRPLPSVQHPDVRISRVRVQRHLTAEGVYLAHDMPLRGAADAAVARHQRHVVQVERQQECAAACASRRERGLATCMSRPYDDNIVFRHLSLSDLQV